MDRSKSPYPSNENYVTGENTGTYGSFTSPMLCGVVLNIPDGEGKYAVYITSGKQKVMWPPPGGCAMKKFYFWRA